MQLAPISRAILYAARHYDEQPGLARLAAVAGLSPSHFQRAFRAAVGISPKNFVAHLSAQRAAAGLRRGHSVLDAALESGLSGPGRLHDLIIKVEGATPGELASGGEGLEIRWTLTPTPCGPLFAARAPKGLCYAAFAATAAERRGALAGLRRLWPRARLRQDPAALRPILEARGQGRGRVRCWVPGTPFQLQVWRALARLPAGRVLSYQGLGRAAGLRGARAVGGAVAANPVAWFIPCHRVIQQSGAVGGYHWGVERKRALLALEGADGLDGA